MKNSKTLTANAVRMGILALSSTLIFPAMAEEAEKPTERIEVTGSKIKRIGELSPTPITVITGDTMVDAGITNVAGLLEELPSATTGLSPETTNNSVFANGLNNADLRGMGTDRTLVLVNGRRFVSGSPTSSAVDLNNIPTSIIERIEISTGGASAVYGSDAVAGVVNIVTKKSFDGFEVDASTRQPSQDGGESSYASFTFGNELDKLSFIGNVSYTKDEQLRGDQRSFIRNGVLSYDHPDNVDNTDGIPRRTILGEGQSSLFIYSKTGDFFAPGGHYVFADNGDIREFEANDFYPASKTQGSRNTQYYTGEGDGYNFLEHKYVRTPLERINAMGNFTYDYADDHSVSLELLYSDTHAYGESSPAFFSFARQRTDNPLLTEQARQFFQDKGMQTFNAYYLGSAFGNRKYDQQRDTARASLSFEGGISESWSYDAYAQFGQVKQHTEFQGEVLTAKLREALDAGLYNGQIVCAKRDAAGNVIGAVEGCTPANIWGKDLVSQQSLDYFSTVAEREATIEQTVFGATVSGDVFELPAGTVVTAFTYEYRKESSVTEPDENMTKGLIFGNASEAMNGGFSVNEAAVEVSVPLISDVFLISDLTLETAYRFMDYSEVGQEDAWKASLNWTVSDDLKLRFNKSKSVRAPNISELYNPKSQTYAGFNDPCEQGQIDNAGQYKDNIVANCRAAGIPVGWAPSNNWKSTNHPGFIVGNTDLSAEIANDITIGFVYTPQYLENFSVTVDYWEFDMEDMITYPSAAQIVSGCYESESLDNPYCALIERTPGTLEIDNFYQKPVNAATSNLKGTDFEVNYGFDTGFGDFDLRLLGTYLENREHNTTGKEEDYRNTTGNYNNPRLKMRFTANYSIDDLGLALTSNYRHHTRLSNDWTPEDNDYNEVPSYIKWDLTGRYNITDALQVRAGVLNLFDVEPPRNPATYDQGAYFDLDGRTYTLGVNYKF
ncbi:TonB-dependent receptor [Shewanella sp. JM162201]|uniref:TonB-dependent receptor n=1 Tax=Shewanella jiangmenensis TaxID=2837387 RepID=A0ABS5V2N1_9GAMM|nr:TonB-dependent receptor [Shewanella jiangmenensis]MBT1443323.1 TonB-dependent receptor [Shewanella jiangmenensis]